MSDTHVLRCFGEALAGRTERDIDWRAPRVVYVRSGSVSLRSAGQVVTLSANSAWFGTDAVRITSGANGAEVLEWELALIGAQAPKRSPLLESNITLDPSARYLMRCDRVDFPIGGIAYTHTHRGPGIRCVLLGEITVKVGGTEHRRRPGEAWFEAGPDPVLALASEHEPTSFARVMILPLELRGMSSIKYVLPEDQDKPKRQAYQLFVDDPIDP
ncbi:MAG: hypothetical protein ACKVQT_02390 [Burkholderiales bacterium]